MVVPKRHIGARRRLFLRLGFRQLEVFRQEVVGRLLGILRLACFHEQNDLGLDRRHFRGLLLPPFPGFRERYVGGALLRVQMDQP